MPRLRVVILDFDGVVVESAGLKTEAFARLFEDFPGSVDEFVAYHRKNMGYSRHRKIRHFYEGILGRAVPEGELERRSERFRALVHEGVLAAPLVRGVESFLARASGRYGRYVASGTPEEELRGIVAARRIGHLFEGVHGSPREKDEIVRSILDREDAAPGEAVLVGDGDSDRRAAREVGVEFVARLAPSGGDLSGERYAIDDFEGFEAVLDRIERGGD